MEQSLELREGLSQQMEWMRSQALVWPSWCMLLSWPLLCSVWSFAIENQGFGLLSQLPTKYALTMLSLQSHWLLGIYWHQSPQVPDYGVYMWTGRHSYDGALRWVEAHLPYSFPLLQCWEVFLKLAVSFGTIREGCHRQRAWHPKISASLAGHWCRLKIAMDLRPLLGELRIVHLPG